VALSRSRHVAYAFVVALALGVGSSALLTRDAHALAPLATLTGVDGDIFVRHGDAGFEPAQEGDLVAAGDMIRTATSASAEITYFEGSTVRLEGDSQIVVKSLDDPSLVQTVERAWRVVAELVSGSSRYNIRTPTSTASVRG
jgi:hypothetical protein